MRLHHLVALSLSVAFGGVAAASTAGEGLKISAEPDAWSPWQARLAIATSSNLPLWSSLGAGAQPSSALLAGDRYLGWGRLGDGGGVRATGALLLGSSALSLAAPSGVGHGEMLWRGIGGSIGPNDQDAAGAMPYLGLGYSAWWARAGVGVSADLGLAAQRPGQAVRFGRAFSGAEGFDEVLKAMQISPMLQVNLSYAF
ncbi:MAG: hypothetical protein U1F53_16100 [Burkholderiaceae bacterium]